MKKRLCAMFVAAAAATVCLTACGKKQEPTPQAVQPAKPSLPSLDVEDSNSVMLYYAACIAAGEYDKAAGVAKSDGMEIVNMLKKQPDSKQSKKWIAAFEKITKSFASVLDGIDKTKNSHTFRFKNTEPAEKIGVRMEAGQYWVADL